MEFTIIGDAVNLATRYCDGARDGEVLLSPEMHARVWHLFSLEETGFSDKHGRELIAHRVSGAALNAPRAAAKAAGT